MQTEHSTAQHNTHTRTRVPTDEGFPTRCLWQGCCTCCHSSTTPNGWTCGCASSRWRCGRSPSRGRTPPPARRWCCTLAAAGPGGCPPTRWGCIAGVVGLFWKGGQKRNPPEMAVLYCQLSSVKNRLQRQYRLFPPAIRSRLCRTLEDQKVLTNVCLLKLRGQSPKGV